MIPYYQNLGMGYHIGGEVYYFLSSDFSLILRVEKMMKEINLSDSFTGNSYLVNLTSLPMMAGIGYELFSNSKVSLSCSALFGVGLQTGIQVTSATDATGMSANALSGLAKLELHYQLSQAVSTFVDGGYRYLVSSPLKVPTPVISSSSILNQTFSINLSGPVLEGGLSVRF
jgi:hypothetical protein